MNKEVNVTPYILRFAIAYSVALIGVGAVLTVANVGGGSSGSIASLIAGVAFAVTKFVKETQRVPTSGERKRLTWLSLAASFVVSLVLVVGVLAMMGQLEVIVAFPQLITQIGSGLVVGVLVLVTALYAIALWFSYGWFAKIQYKSMERKGEI